MSTKDQAKYIYNEFIHGCKHDGTFVFYCDNANGTHGWVCNVCLTYTLNFDPDTFPNSTACVVKEVDKRITIDYTVGKK